MVTENQRADVHNGDIHSTDSHRADSHRVGLAEGRWLWRRLYVFAASLGLWALLARTVDRAPPDEVLPVFRGLVALQALIFVLYLIAPSAQQVVELLARLRLRLGA